MKNTLKAFFGLVSDALEGAKNSLKEWSLEGQIRRLIEEAPIIHRGNLKAKIENGIDDNAAQSIVVYCDARNDRELMGLKMAAEAYLAARKVEKPAPAP